MTPTKTKTEINVDMFASSQLIRHYSYWQLDSSAKPDPLHSVDRRSKPIILVLVEPSISDASTRGMRLDPLARMGDGSQSNAHGH